MSNTFAEKEKEMREQFPYMFGHSEAREGEVFLGDMAIDAVSPQMALYKKAGLKSVRKGEGFPKQVKGAFRDFSVTYFPLFASLGEFIAADEQKKAKA